LDRTTGSHFIFYNKINKKKRATIPFYRKELPKGTIMSILRETGITKKELLELLKK
jgi:predicted RNA binding protein YcfA (HicA-like mRNA interferase family)